MVEALLYSFLSVSLLFLAINVFLAIAKRVFGSFRNKKVPEGSDKTPKVALSENKPVNNNSPDFNSRKKSRVAVIFLIILILLSFIGSAFYWYELRPAEIKKYCFAYAYEESDKQIEGWVKEMLPEKYEERKNTLYDDCLHSKGL